MGSHWYRPRDLGGGLGRHSLLGQEEGSIEEGELKINGDLLYPYGTTLSRGRWSSVSKAPVSSSHRVSAFLLTITLESEHNRHTI